MGARWVPSQWLTLINHNRTVCAQAWSLACIAHEMAAQKGAMDTSAVQERIKRDLHGCMTDRKSPMHPALEPCLPTSSQEASCGPVEILLMKLRIMCSMVAAVSAVSCTIQWIWLSIGVEL